MPSDTSPHRRVIVADALHSAAIHLLRGVRKEDEATGVGPAQLSALSVLVFAGAMRLTELAVIEQVKPPTMTKVISGLRGRGLVKQRADPNDGRAVRLEATGRGTRLLQQGRQRRIERLAAAFSTLGPQELDVLARAAAIVERISTTL